MSAACSVFVFTLGASYTLVLIRAQHLKTSHTRYWPLVLALVLALLRARLARVADVGRVQRVLHEQGDVVQLLGVELVA